MKLEILSPQGKVFSGDVTSVSLPGKFSAFEVLNNHAPIISSLGKGKITYKTNGEENELTIDDGFVEVTHNTITICIEKVL